MANLISSCSPDRVVSVFPKRCVWNEGDGSAARWGSPSPSPSSAAAATVALFSFPTIRASEQRGVGERKSLPVGRGLCPQRGLFSAGTHWEPGMV